MGGKYYDRLGVPADASTDEITTAYRERLKETHPDVSDAADAKERTRRLIEAKEVLTDDTERARYDRLGHDRYVRIEHGEDDESNRDDDKSNGERDGASHSQRQPGGRTGPGSQYTSGTTGSGSSSGRGTDDSTRGRSGATDSAHSRWASSGDPSAGGQGRDTTGGQANDTTSERTDGTAGRNSGHTAGRHAARGRDSAWDETDWEAVSEAVWAEVTGASHSQHTGAERGRTAGRSRGDTPDWGQSASGGAASHTTAGTATAGATPPGTATTGTTQTGDGDQRVGWYRGGDPSGTGHDAWSFSGSNRASGRWRPWTPGRGSSGRHGPGLFSPHQILSPIQTVVLFWLSFLAYPLLVVGAVSPLLTSPTRLLLAVLLVFVVALLIVLPQLGVVVFGAWTLLFPVALANLDMPLVGVEGVLAVGITLLSLGLALLSRPLTRPPAL